jgi:acetyl esterase
VSRNLSPRATAARWRRWGAVIGATAATAAATLVVALTVVVPAVHAESPVHAGIAAERSASGSTTATPAARAADDGGADGAGVDDPGLRVGIRTFVPPAGIKVTSDISYADDAADHLDVCSPAGSSSTARPAVLSIHGGSWTRGDEANSDWRNVCEWLASAGFVTYSLDYRLVPADIFPTQIDDVTNALRWIREPANVARFGIDPRRIGVFGGSAGGNLASLLGMRGSGDIHSGARVAAVAELSGPVDLTQAGQSLGSPDARLQSIELAYLGCTSFADCPNARAASAVYDVDSSDPPVFIGASSDEFVPVEQDEAFAAALQKAGVPHTLKVNPGHWHSIATLDASMRESVVDFLHKYLGS